jgi:fructokinase
MPKSERPQPRHVLVVGESLVDVLADPADADLEAPGGSPLNVAVTLGRMGTPVSILTALGNDDRGEALRGHLAESGVEVRRGPVLPRTSSAVARVAPNGSATYEFDIAWPALEPLELRGAGIVHTGSIAFFCAPGAASVMRLLRDAHESGALTTLDPNVRPALVGDPGAALRHFEASLPWVDVLKLSVEDAAWLYPGLGERAVVARLLETGPSLVALTDGSSGASLHTRSAEVDVPAAPTTVVDTIGAGDAWMGALIHGLFNDPAPKQLVQRLDRPSLLGLGVLASRVAAATVATRGADPPWAAALDLAPSDPAPLTPTVIA